ncbi:diaminopimelate decarboxylase [soil metagenome]
MTNPLAPEWLIEPSDANEIAPAVWPRNSGRDDSGELAIGGVPASVLAAEYGTPLYVVDEQDVRSRALSAREAFDREFARVGSSAKVYYAAKAFLSTEIARWVTEAGLYIDVCSGGELAVALAAGVDASRLGFHGNNKSLAEIDRAVRVGIGVIVIDSEIEIQRVADAAARHSRTQQVRLRLNSGVHAQTHEYLATAHEDQKFGVTIAEAPAMVAAIRATGTLEFLGLHSHIGSQIFESDAFVEAARRLLNLQVELLDGGPVPELNLGGGFGIAYTTVDEALPLETVAARFGDIVSDECARLGIAVPLVAVEPGRSIVGPSTVTLYEVGTIKDVTVSVPSTVPEPGRPSSTDSPVPEPGRPRPTAEGAEGATAIRKYVSVDGGMSDNIRPALYGADYTVRIAGRWSGAAPALVRVAGKHCESGDIVVRSDYLPGDVQPGDLLAVAATGAYCWALSNNYNYLGRPPVVAVSAGVARIIVRGETEADLLSRDAGIRSPGTDN